MPRYGKFVDGVFEWAPINFVTPTGRTIINFNRKARYLEEYGFLPVQTAPVPDYDPETEEAVDHYAEGDGVIFQSWTIEPLTLEGGE